MRSNFFINFRFSVSVFMFVVILVIRLRDIIIFVFMFFIIFLFVSMNIFRRTQLTIFRALFIDIFIVIICTGHMIRIDTMLVHIISGIVFTFSIKIMKVKSYIFSADTFVISRFFLLISNSYSPIASVRNKKSSDPENLLVSEYSLAIFFPTFSCLGMVCVRMEVQ